ncbi:MAG: T9SS type A sorting domain-containing protein, partial [Calditrichaeota bacterium]|nr:T9SS type A sorting domain-containing protein [Calditrichota bacterium]
DILIQQTNERVRLYRGNNNLNLSAIGDSGGTVIRYVIDKDVFNEGQPLINNAEYYFSVTSFSINVNQLSPLENGAWIGSADPYLENPLGGAQLFSVIFNRDENRPFKGSTAEYIGTRTGLAGRDVFDGRVVFDVVDRDALTNDNYLVSFFNNGDFYSITNESQNRVLRDTLIQQDSLAGNSWTFPIIDGLSIRVKNVPDGINSVEETMPAGGVDWLDGAAILTSSTAAYNGGVDFIQNSFRSNLSPGLSREDYFPVRLVLGTTDDAFAQHFRANYNLSVGMKPTFLKAFDMTDPNSPRQLYVAYHNASPTGIVDFSSNNDIIIFKSDYAGDAARYGRASTDTLFRDEAYLVAQFVAVDSILQANEMTLDITPYYPNSNVDEYRVHTEDVQPLVTAAERKDQLEMVNVVPNPYWAYSAYETSYDTPVIKFTHLPNEVTIRIFNLAGQLIKTLSKNNVANELTWNLRNESNLRVASGMYLAHVEAPEIGEKILKFAIIQREERLDRF